MIQIFSLVIALIVALLRGGRLENVSAIRLRLAWLILAAFGLQAAVVYMPQLQGGGSYELPATLIVLSYLMLLAGVIANRQIGGIKLLGLGLLLNFIVIMANGGFMPIAPEAANSLGLLPQGLDSEVGLRIAHSKDIVMAPDRTVFWVLSDVFVIGRYMPLRSVFSLGDVISAAGLFLALQVAMLPSRGIRQQQPSEVASRVS